MPILIEIMQDDRPENRWLTDYVGRSIAEFGKPGFQALAEQLQGGNPNARRRAADGMLYSNCSEAIDEFAALLDDLDPAIRQIAQLGLELRRAIVGHGGRVT